jgi:hypothetical protein
MAIARARRTAREWVTSRSSALFAVASMWARTSMVMAGESQNVVAVMSAMTAQTPGVRATASSSPIRPALALSISAGMRTIATLAGCSGSPTWVSLWQVGDSAAVLGFGALRAVTFGRVTVLQRAGRPPNQAHPARKTLPELGKRPLPPRQPR